MQVVGFKESDAHADVLEKGAKGLGLTCGCDLLLLICSGGMVPDSLIEEKPWTLGEYIRQHGGNSNRSKKVWGICVPVGIEEEEGVSTSTDDPVSTLQCILDSCRVTIL